MDKVTVTEHVHVHVHVHDRMVVACRCLNAVLVLNGAASASASGARAGTATCVCTAACTCTGTGTAPVPALADSVPFFAKKLERVFGWTFRCEEQSLIESKRYGAWTLSSCVLCDTPTHAVSASDLRCALVPVDLKIAFGEFKERKKSEKFSSTFNLLLEEPEKTASIEKFSAAFSHPAAEVLNKKLIKAIENETERVEEAIRIYRDRQFEELDKFKERAQRDHRIALSMIAERDDVREKFKSSNGLKNEGNRTDSFEAVGRPKSILKLNSKDFGSVNSHTEDSLNSEEMFEFEDMDSVVPNNGQKSDTYDSDDESEDSGSCDEGIHIARHDNQHFSSIGRSLPINMPEFSLFHNNMDYETENKKYPCDIAANIKALARSVHGDEFDLPRPRLNTQI